MFAVGPKLLSILISLSEEILTNRVEIQSKFEEKEGRNIKICTTFLA
jgi:hypothetical protein